MHLRIYGIFFIQKKNKTVWSLPPTSNVSHGHILRSLYVDLICSNLISTPEYNLNPLEFGRNSLCSVLVPNKCTVTLPEMYTVTCSWKKNALQDISAGGLALDAKNFASALEENVVPKLTNRFSWTLHKICEYEVFLWATFSRIWTESKDIYGKIRIIENLYIPMLILVWRILLISPENYTSLNKNNRL